MNFKIDVQGHRGCRGIMPENSVPGFLKAIELGVNTLEMDAVVSKDNQIIISHEPFMSSEISLQPDGIEITQANELRHNLYKMPYSEICTYDTGTKFIKRFPNQMSLKVHKPTLTDVVAAVKAKLKAIGRSNINFNIEIKRKTKWDFDFHPPYQEFADLLIKTITTLEISDFTTVQCFDTEVLRYISRKYPRIKLVFLVENHDSPENNIAKLGFVPEIYSPDFKLVDDYLVDYCGKFGMTLIPWTVNEIDDIEAMLAFGVSGIISDYPDRVMKVLDN